MEGQAAAAYDRSEEACGFMPSAGPVADRVLVEMTSLGATQRRMEMVLKVIQQEVQGIATQMATTSSAPVAVKCLVPPANPAFGTRGFRPSTSNSSVNSEISSPVIMLPSREVPGRGDENNLRFLSQSRSEGSTMNTASTPAVLASVEIRQGLLQVWSDDRPPDLHNLRSSMTTERSFTVMTEVPKDSGGSSCMHCGMVDPNSTFHFGYSQLLLLVLFHDLTFIPVILAWEIAVEGWLLRAAWCSCIFWTVDLAMNFLTGFYLKGRLVMSFREVALRYLKGCFVPDFLMVACDWLSLAALWSPEASLSVRMMRIMRVGKLLRIAGLFRVAKVASVLLDLIERNLSETVRLSLKCGMLVVGTLLLNHLIGCTWFAIGRLAHTDTGMRWVDHSRVMDGVELDFLSTGGIYQWITAIHWSMSQITLGSIEFSCSNSIERAFTIVSMAIGMVFSSTLVSSLSASMVDYQMIAKDKREKMARLRRFLREKRVASKIAHPVLQQANERVNAADSLREEDVHVLPLLSKTLRAQLRFELFQHHLKSHALFNLWSCFDVLTVQWICMEALGMVDLSPQDDLFTEGTLTHRAYYLSRGDMTYIVEPVVGHTDDMVNTGAEAVNEGSWMSEASLWLHWTHVGTAKATTKCEVTSISADELIRVLRRSRVLLFLAQKYCQVYQQCVTRAKAYDGVWPSDLLVPQTSLPDVMLAMDFGAQTAVSLRTIEYAKLTQWNLPGLSIGANWRLHTEVSTGECCAIMNSNQAERLVSQVLLLLAQQDKILVEFHWPPQDGQKPTCWLPGVRPVPGEPRDCSATRLLERMSIPETDVEYFTMKRTEEVKNVPGYGMPTRFVKHTHHMRLTKDLALPTLVVRSSAVRISGGSSGSKPVIRLKSSKSNGSLLSLSQQQEGTPGPMTPSPMNLGSDLDTTIYAGNEQNCLYIWLSPQQFEHMQAPAGQRDWAAWVQGLHIINVDDADCADVTVSASVNS